MILKLVVIVTASISAMIRKKVFPLSKVAAVHIPIKMANIVLILVNFTTDGPLTETEYRLMLESVSHSCKYCHYIKMLHN